MPIQLSIRGIRVHQLFQSYITPPANRLAVVLLLLKRLLLPHVKGIKNPVMEDINKTVPIQSIAFNFSITKPSLRFSLRERGMVMNATRQKGRFWSLLAYTPSFYKSAYQHTIQKIQRHVDFSVKTPPMTGPVTDPIAHCRLIIENHFPLSLKVTISVTIT